MVPDRQLIMENMLMAEGFVEAKGLAKKFASLYFLLEVGRYAGASLFSVGNLPCMVQELCVGVFFSSCRIC